MNRSQRRQVNNIILNENAYFFKNVDELELSNNKIEQLFRTAARSSGRVGHNLLSIINEPFQYKDEQLSVSICVFRYNTKPRFIIEAQDGWYETKIAYLVILDFSDYIVITKKNISGITEFLEEFQALDYKLLSTVFVNEETAFEKFGLKNMNISDKAIREKSLEANDLRENFSPIGANNYVLSNIRLNNNNEKISLSLNTGRINKFGKKNGIQSFINWSGNLIEEIEAFQQHDTFLSIFAEPLDYEDERDTLVPIAVLFLFSKLYEDIDNHLINDCVYEFDEEERSIPITKHLSAFERLCQISIDPEDHNRYLVSNPLCSDLEVRKNQKSITFRSERLSRIKLVYDGDFKESIVEYINRSNQFIMNFDNVELVYTNRKLFKDNKLMGNIEHFLKIFKPYPHLETVTSEKGTFTAASTAFTVNSIFNFVESEFMANSTYFICDDLEKEWADHISITDDRISFYLSKFGTSQFSASAFQDIIGQAQKNLGNLSAIDYQIDGKQDFWQGQYHSNLKNNAVQTRINRLRKGTSVQDAVNQYKKTKLEPNVKREMNLVINFISKAGLEEKLEQLKNAEVFAERNEIIQILWFISSLILSCSENGIEVYIHCKP